jgi:acetyl/propionyl-CoA carboxylase alpha subunit
VEFLVEGAGDSARFYFLEMNTRLQVEHPVTEAVVGVDLVRAQLSVASGKPLPWTASSLTQRGHAIEARVYAEDPAQGFLPQAGRLLLYREPVQPGIRIDSGVVEGSDVPIYYDPLIGKVIASDETRPATIARLISALRSFPVLGIRTNIPFLLRILEHKRFQAGGVDTGFLDDEGEALARETSSEIPSHVLAALSFAAGEDATSADGRGVDTAFRDPWDGLRGWRI